MRIDRVVLETAHYVIVGDVRLPREGYRSRFSDFLNRGEINFVPLTEAELYPRDGSEPEGRGFVAVSTKHVQLAYHYDEFEEMDDPYARDQASVRVGGDGHDDPGPVFRTDPEHTNGYPPPAPTAPPMDPPMNLEADDVYPRSPAPPSYQAPQAQQPASESPRPSEEPGYGHSVRPGSAMPGSRLSLSEEYDGTDSAADSRMMNAPAAIPELNQPSMGLPSPAARPDDQETVAFDRVDRSDQADQANASESSAEDQAEADTAEVEAEPTEPSRRRRPILRRRHRR